jgi:hypothetical protein
MGEGREENVRSRPRFANPAFDQALAECKADKSWTTLKNPAFGHVVMLDEPEWLAGRLEPNRLFTCSTSASGHSATENDVLWQWRLSLEAVRGLHHGRTTGSR